MNHDTCFVHEVQRLTKEFIKETHPLVTFVHHYSDGCAKQYRNYKNFLNFCFHHYYFLLSADWTFFATSHGKSPCDGIGGTVKRLTARASLQRPINDQILGLDSMSSFCSSNIKSISFHKVTKEQMVPIREQLEKRYKEGSTVPGTPSYHFYEPVPYREMAVRYKRVSEDNEYCGEYAFKDMPVLEVFQPMQFIACTYDGFGGLA